MIIHTVSKTGGHLASNLGTIELTVALHRVYDTAADRVVFDVGHQSYAHKILTGRRDRFSTLRQYGGVSGFPKPKESCDDAFIAGHASNSIAVALGMAKARTLQHQNYDVAALIGDGAMTGGLCYEGLSAAASSEEPLVIILNDNNMSIDPNVGGLASMLQEMRVKPSYLSFKRWYRSTFRKLPLVYETTHAAKEAIKKKLLPENMFNSMGFEYLGPVDGHDVHALESILRWAKELRRPVIVHVLTQKGRGYPPAERMPARFHGTGPFDIETGLPRKKKEKADWCDIFSTVMCKEGKRTLNLCAVTAAMPDGTGLKRFRGMYPGRFFDVGIAEEHAVTFSAGLAVGGMIPVFAVYSSFLQRAFDQIVHDVCLQDLHVIFAIDRGGLVGADGETHQGIFDLSYLTMIPNMTVMAPKNKWELADMLKWAIRKADGPVAIRYPRGSAYDGLEEFRAPICHGKWEILYDESDLCLLATGSMVETAARVRSMLKKEGANCSLINCRFVKPIDEDVLLQAARSHKLLVTLEENVEAGGFGSLVLSSLNDLGEHVLLERIALPDEYIEAGSVDLLKQETAMDAESIYKRIRTRMIGLFP